MRACKNCRFITSQEDECPLCGSKDLTRFYSGEIIILDVEKSEVAKALGFTHPGIYAVLVK